MLSKIFLMAAAGAGGAVVDLTNYIKFLTNASNVDIVRSTERDSLGNVYIAARTTISSVVYMVLAKLDISGNVVWCKQHGMSEIYNMAVDTSDNLYVLCKQGTSFYVYKYNNLGNYIAQYTTATNYITTPTAMAVDNQNNIIVIGYDASKISYVIKFSNTGTVIFSRQYFLNTSTYVNFRQLTIDSSDNIIVAGDYITTGGYEFCLLKFASDGTLVFQKRFGTSTTGDYDTTTSVTTDASGNIFLAGTATYSTKNVPCITKLDSAGNVIGSRIFQSAENAYSITVISDINNNLYLVASKQNTTTLRFSSFFAKLDTNLNLIFQCDIGLSETGYAYYNYSVTCCVDAVNNLIYITGTLSSKDIELIRLTTDNTKPGTYGSFTIANTTLVYAVRTQTINTITGFTLSTKAATVNTSNTNVPLSNYTVTESTTIIP